MSTLNHAHQIGIFDPRRARKVIVVGVGQVGSHVVDFLARMGVSSIEVFDGQSVSSDNVAYSRYLPKHIGMCKVDALGDIVAELGVSLETHAEHYERIGQADFRNAVVISCVDDMDVRVRLFEQVLRQRVGVDLFCDTRIAGAYVEVLSINPRDVLDVGRYKAMLFPNREAVTQTCGNHGIIHASTRAAGIVAANVAQWWQSGAKEWLVRERCDTLLRVA